MKPVPSLEESANGRPATPSFWPDGLDPYPLVLLTAVMLRIFQVGMDLMSPDDVFYSNAMGYDFAYNPYNVTGRYTSKLLYDVLLTFGVNVIHASFVLNLVNTAFLVLSFRCLSDIFGFRLDPFRLYLAGCLFCLHPYLAENYYLRFESFRFLFLLLTIGGIARYTAGRAGPAVVALLLAAALAINQQALNIYCAVVLLYWAQVGRRARPFGLLGAGVAGVFSTWPRSSFSSTSWESASCTMWDRGRTWP